MTMVISGTSGFTFPDASQLNSSSQVVKAWVNFNGTGTIVINAAFNVGSITDGGAGIYTVNLINAMPDANFAVTGSTVGSTGTTYDSFICGAYAVTTTTVPFQVRQHTGTVVDVDRMNVAIFR